MHRERLVALRQPSQSSTGKSSAWSISSANSHHQCKCEESIKSIWGIPSPPETPAASRDACPGSRFRANKRKLQVREAVIKSWKFLLLDSVTARNINNLTENLGKIMECISTAQPHTGLWARPLQEYLSQKSWWLEAEERNTRKGPL